MPIRILKPDEPITKTIYGTKVTWKPLNMSEKLQLGALTNQEDPMASDSAGVVDMMASKIISIEGIPDGPITPEMLALIYDVNHFWGIARGMLESTELTEVEAKN